MVIIQPSDCLENALWELGRNGNFRQSELFERCPKVSKTTIYHRVQTWKRKGVVTLVKKRENREASDVYALNRERFEQVIGKVYE